MAQDNTEQNHIPVRVFLICIGLLIAFLIFLWSQLPWFIDEEQNPINAETARLLCFDSNSVELRPTVDYTTRIVYGYPIRFWQLLSTNCNHIAALKQVEVTNSNTQNAPSYTIYETSWERGQNQLYPRRSRVVISSANKFVLFDVTVSLAWQPPTNDDYISNLKAGLKDASASLYDATDGQMAFGKTSIYTDGEAWNQADIRIFASNDRRPAAYVGGVVNDTTPYHLDDGTDAKKTMMFEPASILLGRSWDGSVRGDENMGQWNQDRAYRTITHEWGHYALFLFDQYIAEETETKYCPCQEIEQMGDSDIPSPVCSVPQDTGDASVMAYQYRATEFQASNLRSPSVACGDTSQAQAWNHRTDWQTLAKWGEIQGLEVNGSPLAPITEPNQLSAGPQTLGIVEHLFEAATLSSAGDNTIQNINLGLTNLSDNSVTQIYALERNEDRQVTQITHQGSLVRGAEDSAKFSPLGNLPLLGIAQTSEIHIEMDRYQSSPGTIPEANLGDGSIAHSVNEWLASMDIIFHMGTLQSNSAITSIDINIASAESLSTAPSAQLCHPDPAVGCTESQSMSSQGDDKLWAVTFSDFQGLERFPLYWLVRVESERGALTRWVQDIGGIGPSHNYADTPSRDGDIMADATILPEPATLLGDGTDKARQDIFRRCNRILIMPLADHDLLPSGINYYLAGVPLDVDILLESDDGICSTLHPSTHINYIGALEALGENGIVLTIPIDLGSLEERDGTLTVRLVDPATGETVGQTTSLSVSREDICDCEADLRFITLTNVTQSGVIVLSWDLEPPFDTE